MSLTVAFCRCQGEVRRRAQVGVGVTVELVPRDRDRLREKPERDGPLNGSLDAVARLPNAVRLGFFVQDSIVQRLS